MGLFIGERGIGFCERVLRWSVRVGVMGAAAAWCGKGAKTPARSHRINGAPIIFFFFFEFEFY